MRRKLNEVEKEAQRAADKKRKKNMRANLDDVEEETIRTTAKEKMKDLHTNVINEKNLIVLLLKRERKICAQT